MTFESAAWQYGRKRQRLVRQGSSRAHDYLAGFAGWSGDGRSGALSSFIAASVLFAAPGSADMPSAVDPRLHCSGTAAS